MKKGWKIVGVVVLVIIVLGAICVGIGLLTGADGERIYNVLDQEYNITSFYQQVMDGIQSLKDSISSM